MLFIKANAPINVKRGTTMVHTTSLYLARAFAHLDECVAVDVRRTLANEHERRLHTF